MKPASFALSLLLFLAACGDETPGRPAAREPGPDATGALCRMALSEHRGPKAQLFLKGDPTPLWFSSVRDLFAWLREDGAGRSYAAIYVNDMSGGDWDHPAPGSWIDAERASFVAGSDRDADMGGAELVPFSRQDAADNFIAAHGGRITGFKDLTHD